ncbi:hypothetical protein BS78_02G124000 [Paspalum vaginatum]|nr:hypothetical protein BS78_02G124000 [Paspalum vaginatum]
MVVVGSIIFLYYSRVPIKHARGASTTPAPPRPRTNPTRRHHLLDRASRILRAPLGPPTDPPRCASHHAPTPRSTLPLPRPIRPGAIATPSLDRASRIPHASLPSLGALSPPSSPTLAAPTHPRPSAVTPLLHPKSAAASPPPSHDPTRATSAPPRDGGPTRCPSLSPARALHRLRPDLPQRTSLRTSGPTGTLSLLSVGALVDLGVTN